MTRQEAIEKLSTIGHISVSYAEDLYDSLFPRPVVPQYVADWYEKHKNNLASDTYYLIRYWEDEERNSDFYKWFDDTKNEAIKTLVNMHQFGYEVEKETKYRVKMEAARYNGFPQFLCEEDRGIFWDSVFDCRKTKFTRKELEEAGFGWVFDCPGVEVKEVE
nr:MAG: Protein of unknown function (DUF1642) [Bacteriophage sp.]